MPTENLTASRRNCLPRWIVLGVLLGIGVFFAFPVEPVDTVLFKILDVNPRRAVGFLSRLWLYSAPVGAVVGIIFGNLVLRSSHLTLAIITLLRIVRWAPFLMVWTLAIALTVAPKPQLSVLWLATYCAVTVALDAGYEYLVMRHFGGHEMAIAIQKIAATVAVHGLLIALLLTIPVSDLWMPSGGSAVGYSVAILLAAIVLVLNWISAQSFDSIALHCGTSLIDQLKAESVDSFLVALISALFLFVSIVTSSFLLTTSLVPTFASLMTLFATGEFYRDVGTSFGELAVGMLLSGGLGIAIALARERSSMVNRLTDLFLQSCQLAPIAVLVNLQNFFALRFSKWVVLCVAVFTFYPFVSMYTGVKSEKMVARVLVAISEALPYGCAAVVFGEMWNSTAGIGFMMTVAAATSQPAQGLAGFVTFLILFGAFTMLLGWTAKRASADTAAIAEV